jgi:hypothetical protein
MRNSVPHIQFEVRIFIVRGNPKKKTVLDNKNDT